MNTQDVAAMKKQMIALFILLTALWILHSYKDRWLLKLYIVNSEWLNWTEWILLWLWYNDSYMSYNI